MFRYLGVTAPTLLYLNIHLILIIYYSATTLQDLTYRAQDRRKSAFRPGTIKNHRSAQTLFLQFGMLFNINPDQPTCDQLAAYTEWLLQGGLAVATVRNHVAAIKSLYLWVANTDIVAILNSSAWALTVKGILNTIRPSYNIKAAMTPEDLLALMEVAYRYDDLLPLTVALSFGFFGYLRISNLVPQTAATFDPTRHTTVGDVFLRNEGLLVSLKWTKTRQTSRPVFMPLPVLGSSLICPFRAWRLFNVATRDMDINSSTPLLVTTHEPEGLIVTASMLRAMFRKALEFADLTTAGYNPHSLRRGGATFSYHAGVPIDQIKRHGTWRSDTVHQYLMDQHDGPAPVVYNFQKTLTDFDY